MQNIFPIITLYQPWATWIMREWKTIETRTHNRFSSLHGKTILIHAGQKTDVPAFFNPYLTKKQILDADGMVNGFILGSAYVCNIGPLTDFNSKAALIDCHSTNRFGLFLKDIKKFEKPIPAKGEMGIWYFDLDTMQKIKKKEIKLTDQSTLF